MPVVEINVGGRVFASTRGTLERSRWLRTALREVRRRADDDDDEPSPSPEPVDIDLDRDGRLFIDRDPTVFGHAKHVPDLFKK
eukprot:gene14403-8830_t